MSEGESKSLDILGIKPVGDAVLHVTTASVDGTRNFLARLCMPAAEEFGLLLQDKVKIWRANNAAAVLAKAELLLKKNQPGVEVSARPRLVHAVLENASWTDDDLVQNMWAGLLASGCTTSGGTETNLIFAGLLSRLTSVQARVLNYGCEHAPKKLGHGGLIYAGEGSVLVDADELLKLAGILDIHQLDVELDHLRELGLIGTGFLAERASDKRIAADVTVTALGLNLYVRSQGYIGSAGEYFGLSKSS